MVWLSATSMFTSTLHVIYWPYKTDLGQRKSGKSVSGVYTGLSAGIVTQGCCPRASDRNLGGFPGLCGRRPGCCQSVYRCYAYLALVCLWILPVLISNQGFNWSRFGSVSLNLSYGDAILVVGMFVVFWLLLECNIYFKQRDSSQMNGLSPYV